jgi:cyclic pyranopterin phosphate synthase
MNMAKKLSHLDELGKPRMVDVTGKATTQREAITKGTVHMKPSTLALIQKGQISKGDVLTVAQIAGIQAAKRTPELIPLCHPLLLGEIRVEFEVDEANSAIYITSTVKNAGQTGVEMESLTATTVAALTIYDMCKAVEKGIKIDNIRLVRKSGGKSGLIELE